MVVKMGRTWFAWAPRTDGITDWDEEIRYDRFGRGSCTLQARMDCREKGLEPLEQDPQPGYVFKRETTDAWEPCRETADGAVPAWIWYAR